MDKDSKRILKRVIVDVVCLALVGLPLLYFFLGVYPYRRGFYCDDESIRYPFKPSTVPSYVLYTVGFGLPITTMLILEYVRFSQTLNCAAQSFFGIKIHPWIWRCYCVIGVFGFGAACSQLTTDIAKYSIGRLRPHFLDVCKPNVNCDSLPNQHIYITDFTCTNEDEALVRAARLSFPSGHSSFSFYTMVYLVIYLQKNFMWRGSKLLKHTLQFICLMLAWSTALSRVSNYKHHWSDILVGGLQGTVVAVLVTCSGQVTNSSRQVACKSGVVSKCLSLPPLLEKDARQMSARRDRGRIMDTGTVDLRNRLR